MHPKCSPSVHPRVYIFKVYFSVSYFLIMTLNRTKLKYGTIKLKAYGNIIWIIELDVIYLLGLKVFLLLLSESALSVYLRFYFFWYD